MRFLYDWFEDLNDKKFGYLSSEEDEKINQVIKKIDEKIEEIELTKFI